MKEMRTLSTGLLLAVACMASMAQAQVPAGFEEGVHIVRPGENLREITRNYLGSEALWEENWKLNPEVSNPHLLLPGQRLRVLIAPANSVPSARLVTISGDVEGRPAPIDWNRSRERDLMVESDGVRTGASSSTALQFHDGTDLVLTEESIIFLKQTGRSLAGIEQNSVEIVEGQADLERIATAEPAADIEIVIGQTRAVPRPSPSGAAEARLRKAADDGAHLMVYEGESEVEAAGQKISVPGGMGTVVVSGEPPKPPEKLLAAPEPLAPAPGGALDNGFVEFRWQPVTDAAGYAVEVCRDAGCQALLARRTGLEDTVWSAERLPVGDAYWRVTATGATGLDGFPSAARPVSIRPERAEIDAPTGEIRVTGLTAKGQDGRIYYTPAARLSVTVEDPSGVASWTPYVNGADVDPEALPTQWATGEHEVRVSAEDGVGNRGELPVATFFVDADSPTLTWRLGGDEVLSEFGSGSGLDDSAQWWDRRAAGYNDRQAERGRRPAWTVLGWGNERVVFDPTVRDRSWVKGLYARHRAARVLGEAPVILLQVPGARAQRSGSEGSFLGVRADDSLSGIEELVVRTVGNRRDGYRLVAEARDRLGNSSRASWRLGSE